MNESFDLQCPTCAYGYNPPTGIIDTNYHQIPLTWSGTIGSIRLDTNDKIHPISYMLEETGVGSGTIHYEVDLFPSEEEAIESAKKKFVDLEASRISAFLEDLNRRRKNISVGGTLSRLREEIRSTTKRLADLEKILNLVKEKNDEEQNPKC